MHPCTENDFQSKKESFKTLGLENHLCLNDEENNFQLEGFWDEPVLSILNIEIKFCSNDSILASNSTEFCRTPEEIAKIIDGKTFNIYYEDTVVNITDFNEPSKFAIVNDYQYLDSQFMKISEYYFQSVQILSDEGLIFSDVNFLNGVSFVSKNSDFYTRKSEENVFFSLNIYADKNIQKIERSFTKVLDLLAKLGGILQSLLFLGQIFIYFEYSLFLKNTILNSLYSFKKPKKKNSKLNPKAQELGSFSQELTKIKKFTNGKNINNVSDDSPGDVIQHNKKILPLDFSRKLVCISNELPTFKYPHEVLIKFESPLCIKLENQEEKCISPFQISKIKKFKNSCFNNKPFSHQDSTPSPLRSPKNQGGAYPKTPRKNTNFLLEKVRIMKLQNFKQNGKSLYFNFLKYVKLGLKKLIPLFQLDYEEELFIRSNDIYEREMDFIEILKKLQEIEKLKKILLNSNQQILFNFLKKPLVYMGLDQEGVRKAQDKFSIQLKNDGILEMNKFKKAIDDFEMSASNGKLSDIDRRIMRIIDKESSKFLKYKAYKTQTSKKIGN